MKCKVFVRGRPASWQLNIKTDYRDYLDGYCDALDMSASIKDIIDTLTASIDTDLKRIKGKTLSDYCECGGVSAGYKPYMVGHGFWCPVNYFELEFESDDVL
jgi:hypothetical protein